jgi:hypothetical protein
MCKCICLLMSPTHSPLIVFRPLPTFNPCSSLPLTPPTPHPAPFPLSALLQRRCAAAPGATRGASPHPALAPVRVQRGQAAGRPAAYPPVGRGLLGVLHCSCVSNIAPVRPFTHASSCSSTHHNLPYSTPRSRSSSIYLFGRERRVADIPTDHPSCSKQHAVLQFRWGCCGGVFLGAKLEGLIGVCVPRCVCGGVGGRSLGTQSLASATQLGAVLRCKLPMPPAPLRCGRRRLTEKEGKDGMMKAAVRWGRAAR